MDLLNLDLSGPQWGLVWPQLIVFLLAVVLVFADAFIPKHRSFEMLTGISIVGYLLALGALYWQHDKHAATFQGSFRADGLTVFLSLIILVAAIFSVLTSANYLKDYGERVPIGEYYILLAFSVLGALLVSSAGDLITIFVGIELTALATYVLTGYTKRNAQAVEGALKYFLLGIFASAILLYGMAWAYGLSGSTGLDNIRANVGAAVEGQEWFEASVLLALLLLIVGLGFKIAAVPFHMWTPDAYEGAPTPVTAYMSVIPKAAGFAAMIRLLVQGLGPLSEDWRWLIAVLAVLTMMLGNIVALSQRNLKRMLAYSSIAHTGYMMVGLAAYREGTGFGNDLENIIGTRGVSALLYYMLAYVFMNIGAFAVLTWIQARGRGVTLDDVSGLASTDPLPAAAMAVFMVSLMGIPPLIGFYAKYYVILAAMEADMLWLAIAVVLASGISAYFYLRVVAVMYFSSSDVTNTRSVRTPLLNASIILLVIGNLVLGLFSAGIVDLSEDWTNALTVAQTTDGADAAQVTNP
ncbi:MAG: NADH-quinone oxidoreductase subunit N [Thermomicrobiales bacterium]|nr:NADH-quinone oxidoreductase subunit N [Thermomicrobiales bacterium]